ncbi:phosphoribosylanthranilate isomerase [Flavobacterium psychrotrophum]|uniref:phosphoribosylanthranilate isomerase n=1 Tax=Flavobacterium psychrotrophum TaxID=2294119 RepID=UPI0019695201|nr:phosphoribosylanthranilate isomerase [Flavobacterium psychrotrophum]
MTANESSQLVAALPEVSHVGFIFFQGSKRFTDTTFLTSKKKVGVFVNAPLDYVNEQIEKHSLDTVQLHGSESPEYIRQLPKGIEIIKVFGIADAKDLEATETYETLADYFLFDTKSEQHGGTGTAFNWQVLQDYNGDTPFILSGGIGPDSAEALKNFPHPKLAGYDLNSRFEIEPKIKDVAKLANFLKNIEL